MRLAAAACRGCSRHFRQFDEFGGLTVHWRLFGTSGHAQKPEGGVLQVTIPLHQSVISQLFWQFLRPGGALPWRLFGASGHIRNPDCGVLQVIHAVHVLLHLKTDLQTVKVSSYPEDAVARVRHLRLCGAIKGSLLLCNPQASPILDGWLQACKKRSLLDGDLFFCCLSEQYLRSDLTLLHVPMQAYTRCVPLNGDVNGRLVKSIVDTRYATRCLRCIICIQCIHTA